MKVGVPEIAVTHLNILSAAIHLSSKRRAIVLATTKPRQKRHVDKREAPMSRSPQYTQGRRNGVKWAVTWLHRLAREMNDPHAKAILSGAAFGMGVDARQEKWGDPVESSVQPVDVRALTDGQETP